MYDGWEYLIIAAAVLDWLRGETWGQFTEKAAKTLISSQ
jgi:hypothetical protein